MFDSQSRHFFYLLLNITPINLFSLLFTIAVLATVFFYSTAGYWNTLTHNTYTMVQATIVNVSTKIHLDGPLISETKLIMTPSIDTEQNMTISIQMRIEIVEIFKLGTLTVRIDKLYL